MSYRTPGELARIVEEFETITGPTRREIAAALREMEGTRIEGWAVEQLRMGHVRRFGFSNRQPGHDGPVPAILILTDPREASE